MNQNKMGSSVTNESSPLGVRVNEGDQAASIQLLLLRFCLDLTGLGTKHGNVIGLHDGNGIVVRPIVKDGTEMILGSDVNATLQSGSKANVLVKIKDVVTIIIKDRHGETRHCCCVV
jgi:hypothetical protein